MHLLRHGKDVTALFDRLGLNVKAYREFPKQRESKSESSGDTELISPLTVKAVAVQQAGMRVRSKAPQSIDTPLQTAWRALEPSFLSSVEIRKGETAPAVRMALFSLNGGVGKTTLAASIAQSLSSSSKGTVLVNCSSGFALEQYLQIKGARLGGVSFLSTGTCSEAVPVPVIDACPLEGFDGVKQQQRERLIQEAVQQADLVLFDMPVIANAESRSLLLGTDLLVVPIVPDLQSTATVALLDAFLCSKEKVGPNVHFVLNRYDSERSFHREVRARFEAILEKRLLPVVIPEDPLIQDATASGLTVLDYAPHSEVSREIDALAQMLTSPPLRSSTVAKNLFQGEIA